MTPPKSTPPRTLDEFSEQQIANAKIRAGQVEYNDPEIRAWERQLRMLETQRRAVTGDDKAIAAQIIHKPNGYVSLIVVTEQGHIWVQDETKEPLAWVEPGPPVPNTPAATDYEEIAELKRKIEYRRKTRGTSMVDDDIADLVDEEG